MKLRGIVFGIIAVLLVIGYYFWGNPISVFFIICLGLCTYYFLSTLNSEKYVVQKYSDNAKRQKVFSRHRVLRSVLLMSLLFMVSIIVLRYYIKPWDKTPYFNNTDYTMLMNTGLGFHENVRIYTASKDANSPGLYTCPSGHLDVSSDGKNHSLIASHFLQPIFMKKDDRWTVQNNPYPQALAAGMRLANDKYALEVIQISKKRRFFMPLDDVYDISFAFHDFHSATIDTFYVHEKRIKKGISLFDLFLKSSSKTVTFPSAGTRSRMDRFLYETKNCLLLANLGESNYLTFFPSLSFESYGYKMKVNEKPIEAQHKIKILLPSEARFHVGLSRSLYKMYVSSGDQKPILRFDYNKYFPLTPAVSNTQVGFSQIRFIATHYQQVVANHLREGFLVQDNLRPHVGNAIAGSLRYNIDRPGRALDFVVTDQNINKEVEHGENQTFVLKSKDGKLDWVIQLKDFYHQDFGFMKIFIYLSILFLGVLVVLLFFPSPHLTRIEPIIYAIIYAFVVFRFLLLWRVATFPPVDGISNHELGTLRYFDFNFLGLKLGVPLTLIFPLMFLVVIVLIRQGKFPSVSFFRSAVEDVKTRVFDSPRLKLMWDQLDINSNFRSLLLDCLTYFGFGVIGYFIIDILGIGFLQRIMAILYPVVCYFVLSKKYYSKTSTPFDKKYRLAVIQYIQEFIYYMQSNPSFYVAMSALVYLLVTDRGFSIMFMFFLFIKSLFFNFLSTPFNGNWKEMLFSPRKYWIYGILSLIIIVVFLAWKGAFLFLLDHKVYIAGVLLLALAWYLYLYDRKRYLRYSIVFGSLAILFLIPFTSNWINDQINKNLKHVIYRAAIICEPIDGLIYSNKASSFEERKIYETAENQWFINSYLSKSYSNEEAINLRPHFNSGVNYSTQTRDVVLPRYVISEHGSFVMIVLLLLLILPFVYYQMSYGLFDERDDTKRDLMIDNAISGKALLMFFTLGFFVWLTSTNRFVFFGQDFPFLSLTSKMSILLSLVIFGFMLLSKPEEKFVAKIDVGLGATRQLVLFAAFTIVIIAAGRSNLLNTKFFQIRLEEPEYVISNKLNALFVEAQTKYDFGASDKIKLIDSVYATPDFEELYDRSTTYTKSIIDMLRKSPSLAETTTSPIFLRYDNGRYKVEYNKNLHLELPAYDNKQAWKGDVLQAHDEAGTFDRPFLVYGNYSGRIEDLTYKLKDDRSGVVVLPNTWMEEGKGSMLLVDIHNSASGNKSTTIQTYNPKKNNFDIQGIGGFVTPMYYHDVSIVNAEEGQTVISLNPDNSAVFMSNYWVNGKQRMMYPMGDKFFYMYHLAHSFRDMHKEKQELDKDIELTLDYKLQKSVQEIIDANYANNKDPKIKMAVLAANSAGDIAFLNDFNPNKIKLDPNDNYSIRDIQGDQFFFSSSKTERDQWGNLNLMHMAYGPGSSVKPAVAAALASQLHLPWESMVLLASNVFQSSKKHTGRTATYQYAGYRIPNSMGWEDEVGHTEHLENITFDDFIIKSSNFYHSVLMFLGSYPRDSFRKEDGSYDFDAILTKDHRKGKNKFPSVTMGNGARYLPDYKKKMWPSEKHQSKKYFDNPNGILPHGLSTNYNIIVDDQDKNDFTIRTQNKINFTSSEYFDSIKNQNTSAAIWSFPEPSYFLQQDRSYADPSTNFAMGLRNPSLGGAPWYITPLKMLEIYGSLFSQNSQYRLHITPQNIDHHTWNTDASWSGSEFYKFLTQHIFLSMKKVLTQGTARGLSTVLGASDAMYKGYHLYAKTGTIGTGKRNSKRFILVIADTDMTDVTNIGKARFYTLYFTLNEINNNDWNLYKRIIDQLMESTEFKNFMS